MGSALPIVYRSRFYRSRLPPSRHTTPFTYVVIRAHLFFRHSLMHPYNHHPRQNIICWLHRHPCSTSWFCPPQHCCNYHHSPSTHIQRTTVVYWPPMFERTIRTWLRNMSTTKLSKTPYSVLPPFEIRPVRCPSHRFGPSILLVPTWCLTKLGLVNDSSLLDIQNSRKEQGLEVVAQSDLILSTLELAACRNTISVRWVESRSLASESNVESAIFMQPASFLLSLPLERAGLTSMHPLRTLIQSIRHRMMLAYHSIPDGNVLIRRSQLCRCG